MNIAGKNPGSGDADRRRQDEAQGEVARSRREYGHSSEDRNTRRKEEDWPSFKGGGIQRDAGPDDKDRLSRDTDPD